MAKTTTPKFKSKEYMIKVDLFQYFVILVQTNDVIKYRNEVLRKIHPHLKEVDSEPHAITTYINVKMCYVIIPFETVYNSLSEVILHELIHVSDSIIDDHGLEGTEVRAYLTQFMFGQANKLLKLAK